MLYKNQISLCDIYSDEWRALRLGRFTASRCSELIADKPNTLTQAGRKYVWKKVGEEVTGISSEEDIDTNATRHGNLYETQGLRAFCRKMGLEMLVTQRLISSLQSRYSATPDGLIVVRESPDQTSYEVQTVEIKCPSSYDSYIGLFKCKTPAQLKEFNKQWYWQQIMQMVVCGSLTGFFVGYQPYFNHGGMNIIKFSKSDMEVAKDCIKLVDALKMADIEFEKTLQELKQG